MNERTGHPPSPDWSCTSKNSRRTWRGGRRRVSPTSPVPFLEEAGITLEKSSHEYRKLCREALKAAIDATKTELDRMRGDYSRPETAALSTAVIPAPQPKPGPKLSAAIAEFVAEYGTSGHWRKKSREESEGIYRLLVDHPHQFEVVRGFPRRLVVERRAADSHKQALPGDREPGMGRLHHPFPPVSAQRPKALDKKSRSTVSCPILACSSLIVASWSAS